MRAYAHTKPNNAVLELPLWKGCAQRAHGICPRPILHLKSHQLFGMVNMKIMSWWFLTGIHKHRSSNIQCINIHMSSTVVAALQLQILRLEFVLHFHFIHWHCMCKCTGYDGMRNKERRCAEHFNLAETDSRAGVMEAREKSLANKVITAIISHIIGGLSNNSANISLSNHVACDCACLSHIYQSKYTQRLNTQYDSLSLPATKTLWLRTAT